jgi:hypothetical protein
MTNINIKLEPVQEEDFVTLAGLEAEAFRDDEFSIVAFVPAWENLAVKQARGREMAKPMGPGQVGIPFSFYPLEPWSEGLLCMWC